MGACLLAHGEAEEEVEAQAERAEEEGEEEAGCYQPAGDVEVRCVAGFPGAGEEVEGEVVEPAGEEGVG